MGGMLGQMPRGGGGGMIPGYQPGMQRPGMPTRGLPQLPVNGGQMGGGQINPQMIQAMLQMLQGGGGGWGNPQGRMY